MMVFGVHIFIVLAIRLKTCRPNGTFFFTRENVPAQKIGHVVETRIMNYKFAWIKIFNVTPFQKSLDEDTSLATHQCAKNMFLKFS